MDIFTAYMIGTAVKEMREETKKDIDGLLQEGDHAVRLLVNALPHLRSAEARRVRTAILKHLSTSKMAAAVRKMNGDTTPLPEA